MILDIVLLILGLVILILGGEFLVRGACSLALRFHLSPLVVGLTIVAFGTSAPELFISVESALSGSPDLAMGNVVGSNICNLALVLGLCCIINPIPVQGSSIRLDWPVTIGSSLLLFLLVQNDILERWEGFLFVALLVAYNYYIIRKSRNESKAAKKLEEELDLPEAPSTSQWKDVSFMALGCLGLYYGAEWFVGGARNMAVALGVTERVIGITVLALGTSLPELVTAAIASLKKQADIALGNLMGSNIFNILSILGITSIIKDIPVSETIMNVDMVWMLGVTAVVLPMMLLGRKLGRLDGVVLLGVYIYYTMAVVIF